MLNWVFFAVGWAIGICFATACLVGAALWDEWRNKDESDEA